MQSGETVLDRFGNARSELENQIPPTLAKTFEELPDRQNAHRAPPPARARTMWQRCN